MRDSDTILLEEAYEKIYEALPPTTPNIPSLTQAGRQQQQQTTAQGAYSFIPTIGEFKAAFDEIKNIKQSGQKVEALYKAGKIGSKLLLNLLSGGVAGPAIELINSLGDAADLASGIVDATKTLSEPTINKPETSKFKAEQQPILSLLRVNPELSKIVDDEVEYNFLNQEVGKIIKQAETNPEMYMPNMTNVLKDYINNSHLNKSKWAPNLGPKQNKSISLPTPTST